jgi:murein DD-endopeptidase MepM/ murein hydrolase activator NlpD
MIHRNSLLIGLILGSIVAAIIYFFFLERPADAAESSRSPVLESAQSGPPTLSFPVDCVIDQDCWYMAFVDLDARSTYRDHMCGVRTYDAHKGTDIAPNLALVKTLDIVAAASGRVIGIRDGLDDTPMQTEDPARDAARCGNGVRLDHGGGWTTQYCHMENGSVAVSRGDTVEPGDKLGRIGSSGWSELPHLHFQLEKDGVPVDPYLGASPSENPEYVASRGQGLGLWRDVASHNGDSYQPVHIRSVGLTIAPSTSEQAKFGGYPKIESPDAGALVAYLVLFGAPSGARIDTRIEAPAGQTLFTDSKVLERSFAEYFTFAGRKRGQQNWQAGLYTARVTISGNGPTGAYEISSEADLIIR